MTLPEGYTLRPATLDDLGDMTSVANAYDVADLGRADTAREHLEDDLRETGSGERASWLVHDARGRLAAFAMSGLEGLAVEAFGRVHPEHARRGLGTFLVEATEAHAAGIARIHASAGMLLHNAVTSTDAVARRLLDRRGYTLARFFWHMERGLLRADRNAPRPPPGIRIRAARHDDDLRAGGEALDEAFADHWMFHAEPFDTWRASFVAASGTMLLALDGDRVVGAVTFRSTSHGGWVDDLGVRAPDRGRGLGALLLRHAFARLAELGHREVRLNVDADNATGATRLYERVGMRVRREWLVFEKRVTATG